MKRREIDGRTSTSSKRSTEDERTNALTNVMEHDDGLVFEDPFGDEYEEEEVEYDKESVDEYEDVVSGDSAIVANNTNEDDKEPPKQLWRPGVDEIKDDEELEYDPSAYIMYHSLRTEWPCLSFDFLRDDLGDNRHRFPLTMFTISGSQADTSDHNKLTLLKLSDLHRTQALADSDGESDDDENLDEDPTLEHICVPHQGGVNRIRSMPQSPGIVATMADTCAVHVFDMQASFRSMLAGARGTGAPRVSPPTKPQFSFRGHKEEGFAVDWSPAVAGRLATGDCLGAIHIWNTSGSGSASSWQVDPAAYRGHTGSVEDIQWSPTEATVFISASSDRTVKVWDMRGRDKAQISINAHDQDVNVISWNRSVGYLLASGADDGSFKVWDLRSVQTKAEPLAHFRYHKDAITSIEWAPHDESVICLSSADNQITIWDLSVEADDASLLVESNLNLGNFPAQLLFIHQGQSNVKEIHYHPQIPGVIMSTAEDGFNVFKPAISVQ